MAGVLIAVDVALYGGIHGNDTQTADNLRRVGYLAWADSEMLSEIFYITVNLFQCIVGNGQRRAGRILDTPFAHIFYNGILHHLCINTEHRNERILPQGLENSIGCNTDTTLQGQKLWRNMSLL